MDRCRTRVPIFSYQPLLSYVVVVGMLDVAVKPPARVRLCMATKVHEGGQDEKAIAVSAIEACSDARP